MFKAQILIIVEVILLATILHSFVQHSSQYSIHSTSPISCTQCFRKQHTLRSKSRRRSHPLIPKLQLARSDANNNIGEAIEILTEACINRTIDKDSVLVTIKSLSPTVSARPVIDSERLRGQWELVYSTLIPQGYFPIKEICDFFEYSVTSSFGPLPLGRIEGPSEVLPEDGTNTLRIKFQATSISLGPFRMNLEGKEPRIYSFLYVDDVISVAASSSGGYSLLRRVR